MVGLTLRDLLPSYRLLFCGGQHSFEVTRVSNVWNSVNTVSSERKIWGILYLAWACLIQSKINLLFWWLSKIMFGHQKSKCGNFVKVSTQNYNERSHTQPVDVQHWFGSGQMPGHLMSPLVKSIRYLQIGSVVWISYFKCACPIIPMYRVCIRNRCFGEVKGHLM